MARSRKIALLSHRFGNIGHLFMAVGFEEIVRQALGASVEIEHFEQHHFFDIYPKSHPLRLTHLVPHGKLKGLRRWLNDPETCTRFWPDAARLAEFDGAITCGGPSIVRGVSRAPEMGLQFHHQFGAFHYHGVPTFDCGEGSGGFPLKQQFGSLTDVFDPLDKAYFERLFSYSTVSIVRDQFAHGLWAAMGRDAELIPCGAIASGRRFEAELEPELAWEDRHIVINYQRTGANEDWGQGVDVDRWRDTVRELVLRLGKRHKVVFLCHNRFESKIAAAVNADIPRFTPETINDYARVIRNGKAGLASRIHAAIPMAGIGLPVTAIGTDTRLGTLDLMGIKTHFVGDVTADMLEHDIEAGLSSAGHERERLVALRENTIERYGNILQRHVRN